MNRRSVILLITLIVSLLLSSVAFGRDFFLFDLEKNKMLYMGTNDMAFSEKMDLEKVPDLVMPTDDPNKFLAVYMPREDANSDGRVHLAMIGQETEKLLDSYKENGRFMLVDIAKGRVDDIVDIGRGPFETALSKDKKHFAISYRPDANSNSFQILHYYIPDKKVDKMNARFDWVNNLDFSSDSQSVFLLAKGNGEEKFQMSTLSLNPLGATNKLDAGFNPYKVYSLNSNRAVLLDLGGQKETITERENDTPKKSTFADVNGSVELIDTTKNAVLDTTVFDPSRVWYRWYKEQDTLLVVSIFMDHRRDTTSTFEYFGKTAITRATAQDLKKVETTLSWDYDYVAERDTLYVLTDRALEVYDLKNGTKTQLKTGINWFQEEYTYKGQGYITTLNYFVKVLPEADLAMVFSNYKGIYKFFDLKTGKLIQTIKVGQVKTLYKNAYPYDDKLNSSITANQDNTRFFTMNSDKKGVTVYNREFAKVGEIKLADDTAVKMFQIKKPTVQTIIVGENNIYRIDGDQLKSICKVVNKSKEIFIRQEDKRIILWVGDEWYVIDPTTFELKNYLNEYGDPNDKYTKVKKGDPRYIYVPTPYDWSE